MSQPHCEFPRFPPLRSDINTWASSKQHFWQNNKVSRQFSSLDSKALLGKVSTCVIHEPQRLDWLKFTQIHLWFYLQTWWHIWVSKWAAQIMCHTRCPIQTTKQYTSKTIKPNWYKLRLHQVFQFYLPTNHDAFHPHFRSMYENSTLSKTSSPTLHFYTGLVKKHGGWYSFLSPCQAFELWWISVQLTGPANCINKEWGTNVIWGRNPSLGIPIFYSATEDWCWMPLWGSYCLVPSWQI